MGIHARPDMNHTAPHLRACHPKWPHCLRVWHSAFKGPTRKWEPRCWGILGREFQHLRRLRVVQPMLDPVSSGESGQGSARWLYSSRASGARACPDLFCRAWRGPGLPVTMV